MAAASEPTARDASPEVVAALVANHARFLAFLERRLGSRAAAEDVLQEAFVRGLERADSVRDAGSATAWFYRLLRNALVDHHRRRDVERRALERVAAEAPSAAPAHDAELLGEVCRCVLDLLATLKPEYATALRRVEVDGLTLREFAAEAGITANNAGVRLHRARQALRRQLVRSCGTCVEHGCLDCACGGPCGAGAAAQV